MAVSEKDVERVAELANLELAPDDKPRMLKDLNAILDYIGQLNELDTTTVPPMAQVAEQLAGSPGVTTPEVRPDVPVASLDRKEVLSQAPDTDNMFFKVPKVIER